WPRRWHSPLVRTLNSSHPGCKGHCPGASILRVVRARYGRRRTRIEPSRCQPASAPTGSPESDCTRLADSLIMGRKRQTVRPGRGGDQTVCGITVEGAGQPAERDDDLHVGRQDREHSWGRGTAQPLREGQRQLNAVLAVEHLCLPQADRRQEQLPLLRGTVERRPFPIAHLRVPGEPPQPHVGIEQDLQRSASKSRSLMTDSPGAACTLPPSARSCSQGLSPPSTARAGSSRATVLPRRLMVIGLPLFSTRRIRSRQRALKSLTEMSISAS